MFFSTNIQPIDQQKKLFPFCFSSGYIKTKMDATDDKIVNNRHVFDQK